MITAKPEEFQVLDVLIQADPETGKTSVDGIFAGGDIVRGPALVVEAVRRSTGLIIDVHLMIESPDGFIDSDAGAGANGIAVDVEASNGIIHVIDSVLLPSAG